MKKDLKIRENQLKDNTYWENYLLPESLPKREAYSQSKIWLPIVGGIIIALIVGYTLAFIMVKELYYILPVIIFTGLIIAGLFDFVVKKSNCINIKYLLLILSSVVISTVFFSEYFFFKLLIAQFDTSIDLADANIDPVSFIDFFKMRFNDGLEMTDVSGSSGLGSIILIMSWVGILATAWFVTWTALVKSLAFNNEKTYGVPNEVVDFALYHIEKGESEDQVRIKLSEKGWSIKEDQDAVLDFTHSFFRWKKMMKTMGK